MANPSDLKDTRWLAAKLGLSVSTIERMRANGSQELPPCVRICGRYRYEPMQVEWWIQKQLNPNLEPFESWRMKHAERAIP